MNYEELVKALRWCSVDEYVPCTGCPMNEETHGTGCFNIMHQRAAAAIEELLPKRGEWEDYNGHKNCLFKCSVCGSWDFGKYRYCHVCGAKMEAQE